MSEHEEIDRERVYLVDQQTIRVEDTFTDDDLILDLGGGGEGVIGQLRGRQVLAIDRRPDELEEAAPGPIKLIGDACALPFLDEFFDAATAFFFLMYVPIENRPKALAEAYRVLKPGGCLQVWDARIPPKGEEPQEVYAVMIKAVLPDREIETGYGVSWTADREVSASATAEMARGAGFEIVDEEVELETFRMTLRKPA